MKVVINSDYGGFNLSDEAFAQYLTNKDIKYEFTKSEYGHTMFYKEGHLNDDDHYLWDGEIERNDPTLVWVVEVMGSKSASGNYASLKVVEIPDDVDWELMEYDGREWIAEKHRTWE